MKASLLLAAAIATLSLPAMAEVPVPRPNPCESVLNTWLAAGFIEEHGMGEVIYVSGDEAAALMEVYNNIPPASGFQADTAIVIRPNAAFLVSPEGRRVPPGAYDIRFFSGECMSVSHVFDESQWKLVLKAQDKILGTAV